MVHAPTSPDHEVGEALGAQRGEGKRAAVARAAGFGGVRRAAGAPFDMVPEARP